MWALEQWKGLPKYVCVFFFFGFLISLGSPLPNHIFIFTYTDMHWYIFRFNFLKKCKQLFHANDLGEKKAKNSRSRTTKFKCWTCLDKPSVLGHSMLYLSSHQLYHPCIYIEEINEEKKKWLLNWLNVEYPASFKEPN